MKFDTDIVKPLRGYSPNFEFYVYVHRRPDGSIFYVGKGKSNRAWERKDRNNHWCNVVNKHNNYTIEVVYDLLDEQTAFSIENYLIKEIGIKYLTNQTLGGISTTGYKHTKETRLKQRKIARERKKDKKWLSEITDRIKKLNALQKNDPDFYKRLAKLNKDRYHAMSEDEKKEYVAIRTSWMQDTEKLNLARQKQREKSNTPEVKKKISDAAKRQWEDEDFRKMKSIAAAKQWENPEFKNMLLKIRSKPVIVNRLKVYDCIKSLEKEIGVEVSLNKSLSHFTKYGYVGTIYKGLLIEYFNPELHTDVIEDLEYEIKNIFGIYTFPRTIGIFAENLGIFLSAREYCEVIGRKDVSESSFWAAKRAKKNLDAFGYSLRVASIDELNNEVINRVNRHKESILNG